MLAHRRCSKNSQAASLILPLSLMMLSCAFSFSPRPAGADERGKINASGSNMPDFTREKDSEDKIKSKVKAANHENKKPISEEPSELSAQIEIKAPRQVVWEAIHEERESAPGLAYSKILEQQDNHFKIEQKYTFIPFISSITRVLNIYETPVERIDYEVIVTGHEKPLKGSWTLKSQDTDDKVTLLTLCAQSERIEKHPVTRELAKMWLKRRLEHVKEFADRSSKLTLKGQVLLKTEN